GRRENDRGRALFRNQLEPEEGAANAFVLDRGRQLGSEAGAVDEAEAQAVGDVFVPLCSFEQAEQFLASLAELTGGKATDKPGLCSRFLFLRTALRLVGCATFCFVRWTAR